MQATPYKTTGNPRQPSAGWRGFECDCAVRARRFMKWWQASAPGDRRPRLYQEVLMKRLKKVPVLVWLVSAFATLIVIGVFLS